MNVQRLNSLRSRHGFPCDFKDAKLGSYAYFLILGEKQNGVLIVGRFVNIVSSAYALVESARDVQVQVTAERTLWEFVPDTKTDRAKEFIDRRETTSGIVSIASTGIPMLIAGGAAPATFGAAGVTSGLAFWGGGSVAAGGAGMVGGIVVLGVLAPTIVAATGLKFISNNNDNDSYSGKAILPAAAFSGAVSAGGAVAYVAASGTVSGLSGAGITSGLAAIGSGGMLAGMATLFTGVGAVVAVTTGVAYAIHKSEVQSQLLKREGVLRSTASEYGFHVRA
mmetsp:Transcript_37351/g.71595  ORF Transcript_37351/g.71595 Transcript_37351/m.71595 type:complete len:280 (-) Transcript_37351:275-1114(-)|eukprot:CAMPEP_0114247764 /NCGR_PEP_ID=MMETSP0058-20121206/13199_1 /TAXON_ID=36894 /ORGANISM="Pyramimonas parkeae, CCMP726" /LENGTH=279 /DNA_ID=CAMNT_0001361097 /DNA_START=62 /DNA_END=901 /DNA_ORIENTATION=+